MDFFLAVNCISRPYVCVSFYACLYITFPLPFLAPPMHKNLHPVFDLATKMKGQRVTRPRRIHAVERVYFRRTQRPSPLCNSDLVMRDRPLDEWAFIYRLPGD